MWGDKILSGINSIYVNSLACVRIKGGESGPFRIVGLDRSVSLLLLLLLFLRSYPQQAPLKGTILLMGQEKRKDRKT